MWKIQQAMQDDAIQTARVHPAIHPGNRDEVFIWQNFQPAYRDLGWKNRDLGNRTSPPSHMNTSKIYKGFRGEARSRKPGQPCQPGSYEEALTWNNRLRTEIYFFIISAILKTLKLQTQLTYKQNKNNVTNTLCISVVLLFYCSFDKLAKFNVS